MKSFTLLLTLSLCLLGSVFANGNDRDPKPFPHFVKLAEKVSLEEGTAYLYQFFEAGPADEFRLVGTVTDELGFTHRTFQQYYRNVEVVGATYTLHARNGVVETMSGNFFRIDESLPVTPGLSPARGLSQATQYVGAELYRWQTNDLADYQKPQGELVVFPGLDDAPARLAYEYDIYAVEPLFRADVYIDALSGEYLGENARIHHVDVDATGNSSYNGNVAIKADLTSGTYRLRQAAYGSGVETYSLNNGTNYGSATDVTSGSSNFTSDDVAVQAHYGAERTYQYFSTEHGRNSYNNTGGKLLSYVHYSSNYVNAFWDGSRMTYGDGNGTSYGPLVSLDIAGHEMTHGVTEYAAGLVYQRESGALNESFSDIFGEMVEFYATGGNNWQMGTEIGIGGSGAIRSMDNPSSFGDPDTYGGTYWTNPNCGFPTQSNDYCGVHSNSGVQNKWFYILVVGENGTNDIGSNYSVTGIGHTAAAAIAYRNLEVYLSANSTFADARTGAIQSAVDLYGAGSAEEIATTDAWYAVGVGDPFGGPPPATCYGGGITLTINTDNYGSETSWTLKDSGGATIDSGSGYANNTTYTFNFNLANGDYTFTINDSYGDGICCGYGTGSYSLVSGAETIRTGGAFGSFETTNICVDNGGGPPPDTEAPTNPGNLTASNETTSSVDLSWSASTDNVGVTGYNVYVDNAFVGTTANTSATVSGLAENTTFTFKVTALDAAGNESSGSSVNATTLSSGPAPDTEAPSNPGSLTASNETTSSVDLSWTAATDNVGVTGYNIAVNGSPVGSTAGLGYTATGLAAGTTYTFTVTAVDAAGNESSGSSVNATTLTGGGGGTDVLNEGYFESGWDGWTDGGSDCYRDYDSRSYEGNYSIRLRDNSGTASSMTLSNINLTAYDQVDIQFYFYAYSMENGEDFWVQLYNGSSYQTVAAYASGTNFNNNTFYVVNLTLSSADYNFASNGGFRIRCDASGNNDQVYIDAINITGTSTAGLNAGTAVSTQSITQLTTDPVDRTFDTGENVVEEARAELRIFPNPATDLLQVFAPRGTKLNKITVYDISGRRLLVRRDQSQTLRLEVSDLAPGVYFLHVETDQGVERRKFIKR